MTTWSLEDPRVQGLVAVLEAVNLSLAHARLYGFHHAETRRAAEEAWEGIRRMADDHGELVLQSSVDGLLWNDLLVHPETEDKGGLGRLLHTEGIQSISLRRELQLEQYLRLLDVLRINLSLPEYEEETLESLLWQAAIPYVDVETISILSEAEMISGTAVREVSGAEAAADAVRQLLELKVGGEGELEGQAVSEDVLHRAINDSKAKDLGHGRVDDPTADHEPWKRQFIDEAGEDRAAIGAMRSRLGLERAGELLARLVRLLMRVAGENRPELPPTEALDLCEQALDQIYETGDTRALVAVDRIGRQLMQDPVVLAGGLAPMVQGFFGQAMLPRRVVRLLLSLQSGQEFDAASIWQLVSNLPPAEVRHLLTVVTTQGSRDRQEFLLRTLGPAVAPLVERSLMSDQGLSAEEIAVTIQLLRRLGSKRSLPMRPQLLKHTSPVVRGATLAWYADDLPESDVPLLLPFLVDPSNSLRRAAGAALTTHRPRGLGAWLKARLQPAEFRRLPPAVRGDFCVAAGKIGGEQVVASFQQILEQDVPRVRVPAPLVAELEHAALGLAAVGGVRAGQVLRKGASSWTPALRSACSSAIKRMEGGGL